MAEAQDVRAVGRAAALSQDEIVTAIRTRVGDVFGHAAADEVEVTSFVDEASVRLPPEHSLRILEILRDDPELSFEMLMDLTCVHHPGRPLPHGEFDVVYHLTSMSRLHRIRIKVACPDPEAGVASATAVWPGADYMEREAYDMFGVRFQGHPNLKRILLPDEYEGWPLRKDFPYRGH